MRLESNHLCTQFEERVLSPGGRRQSRSKPGTEEKEDMAGSGDQLRCDPMGGTLELGVAGGWLLREDLRGLPCSGSLQQRAVCGSRAGSTP